MKPRFHGIDVVRLLSFFAIATFHISLIHYFTADIKMAEQSWIIRSAEQFSRVLAFSGFTVLLLTSFMTAYSGYSLKKRIRLYSFLTIGWFVFSALMGASGTLVWDIYPLIITGVLSSMLMEFGSRKLARGLGIIGFIMLWIPFWEFSSFVTLPESVAFVTGIGKCQFNMVEWPILPWIGMVWAGYWIGLEVRERVTTGRWDELAINKKELLLWVGILAVSTLKWGAFYNVNLGYQFACEAYRQPPDTFWAHLIWPIFFARLSIDPTIQRALANNRICQYISGLAISRKFWLAYITNYLLAHIISFLLDVTAVEQTSWNTPTIAFLSLFFLPMTELAVRGILRTWSMAKKIPFPFTVGTSLILILSILILRYHLEPAKYGVKPQDPMSTEKVPVLREHVQILSRAIGPRNMVLHPKNLFLAQKYLEREFTNQGYRVHLQPIQVGAGEITNNVYVEKRAQKDAPWIVFGAHYDSHYNSPGADDNASAVAILLELAKHAKKQHYDRNLMFVAFTNEEEPYFKTDKMGSFRFARWLRDENYNVDYMIALESLGYFTEDDSSQKFPYFLDWYFETTGNFLGVGANLKSKSVADSLIHAFRKASSLPVGSVTLPEFLPAATESDNWAFWQHGFRALMVTDTAYYRNPHYHLSHDIWSTLDYVKLNGVFLGLAAGMDQHRSSTSRGIGITH